MLRACYSTARPERDPLKNLRHLPWIALIIAIFAGFYSQSNLYEGDPDRYFHFALARETAKAGKLYLDSVPQVIGLGWHNYFPDKEFLFHQATLLGHHINGDQGVVYASLLFGLSIFLVLYFIASTYLPSHLAFLSTCVALFSPILYRLFLLRPHTMAIFAFLLMQWSLITKRKKMLLVSAAIFVLSYHAFYIAIISLILSYAALLYIQKSEWKELLRFHSWGLAGVIFGILLNPYFPSNLVMGWNIAKITSLVNDPLVSIRFGTELYPVLSNIFVFRFLVPILILCASAILFFKNHAVSSSKENAGAHLYSLLLLFTFLAMATQSPRAGEYAIPVASITLVFTLGHLSKIKYGQLSLLLITLSLTGYVFFKSYTSSLTPLENDRVISSLAAAKSVPISSANPNPIVFNCDWDRTPYLYYAKPEARFNDILDPSLFVIADHTKANLRELFNQGLVPNPRRLMKEVFQADYVMCSSPSVIQQLQHDTSFRQIFPRNREDVLEGQSTPHVFSVMQNISPQFIKKFEWQEWKNVEVTNYFKMVPQNAVIARSGKTELHENTYLNLGVEMPLTSIDKKDTKKAVCATVTPSKAEVSLHQGASLLGVGGGRNIRIWRNGKPLFASHAAFPTIRNVRQLIPIPPVSKNDKFEIAVCSAGNSDYWGLALSFWRERELDDLCKEKAWDKNPHNPPELKGWSFSQSPKETCIAPIAVPLSGH